jgi:transposase
VQESLDGKVSVTKAAELLGLSERQIKRLRKEVSEKGKDALMHGNTGKPPRTALKREQRQEILMLYQGKYAGANFQHYTELLEENEGITVSEATVRGILKAEGIQSPKKRRKSKQHKRRNRKGHTGELVQTDATPHDFFENGETVCLHGVIDDATGDVLGLYMTKNECLDGYFNVFEQMLENFGIPASAYADYHTIFASPKVGKHTIEDELAGKPINDTQFGRAMRELGITLIWARSPQAKGRIERLWGTLQDRLVIEFRINGITDIEAANAFLPGFIRKYNKRFGIEPDEEESMFMPNFQDLINILCVREKRKLDNSGAFSFGNQYFVVIGNISPRVQIEVIVHRRYGIFALYKGQRFNVLRIEKPKPGRKKSEPLPSKPEPYIPPQSHYHKRGKASFVQYSNEYTDAQVLEIINVIFSKSL